MSPFPNQLSLACAASLVLVVMVLAFNIVIDCRIGKMFYGSSVFNNVAFGLRLNRYKVSIAERREKALRAAALWEEVRDKLQASGLSLSGGQQQCLCSARAMASEPEVLLMEEPCAALDPVATRRIGELMVVELRSRYTIAFVTHNPHRAKRVAGYTAFMYVDTSEGSRTGYPVESVDTAQPSPVGDEDEPGLESIRPPGSARHRTQSHLSGRG